MSEERSVELESQQLLFWKKFKKWRQKPQNRSRKKDFKRVCERLYRKENDYGFLTCMVNCPEYSERIEEKSIAALDFLLTNLGNDEEFLVLQTMIAIIRFAEVLPCRLELFKQGVIYKAFNKMLTMHSQDVDVDRSVHRCSHELFIICDQKYTSKRLKELPNYKKIKRVFVKETPYLEEIRKYLKCYHDEESRKEWIEGISCDNCGIMERTVKFQKCGRCHLSFYCGKDCFKRGWKNHKAVCIPIPESSV